MNWFMHDSMTAKLNRIVARRFLHVVNGSPVLVSFALACSKKYSASLYISCCILTTKALVVWEIVDETGAVFCGPSVCCRTSESWIAIFCSERVRVSNLCPHENFLVDSPCS
jgi:hypothetical protein